MKVLVDTRAVAGLLDEALDEVNEEFAERVLEAVRQLKANTPVATGRAQKGWESRLTSADVAQIKNDVPYIGILNDGHSQQAPKKLIR